MIAWIIYPATRIWRLPPCAEDKKYKSDIVLKLLDPIASNILSGSLIWMYLDGLNYFSNPCPNVR